MRSQFFIVFFIFTTNLSAQKCFDIVGQDSLKIFFDSKGIIINNQIAEMYRVYKANPDFFPFNGYFKDYYMNDTLAFIGQFKNGYLDGAFSYFNNGGKLLVKGCYKKGEKDSIWEYYYPNGNLYKRISFADRIQKMIDLYKTNGKPLIINGNGKYQGTIKTGYNKTEDSKINGNIVNGLQDGNWHIQFYYGQATEVFENGSFISGENYDGIKYNQPLTNLVDYLYVENVNVFRYNCFLDSKTFANSRKVEHPILNQIQINNLNYFASTEILLPAYKNKYDFSPFQDDIISRLNKESIISFWAFVEFTIGTDGSLIDIKTYSPSEPTNILIIKILSQMDKFIPASKPQSKMKSPSYIFFPIILDLNNKVLIPKFDNGIIGI